MTEEWDLKSLRAALCYEQNYLTRFAGAMVSRFKTSRLDSRRMTTWAAVETSLNIIAELARRIEALQAEKAKPGADAKRANGSHDAIVSRLAKSTLPPREQAAAIAKRLGVTPRHVRRERKKVLPSPEEKPK